MLNIPLFNTSFAIPAANSAIPPVPLCPSNVPLVLLPVRLETRFFTLQSGVTELRVRIYPDKIHLDSHQPELTTAERSWGMQYWQQDWSAGNDQTARADAWRLLADRYGAARGAWIARTLTPTNMAQRSAAVAPAFPTLPPVGPNGEDAWRTAPQARLMPDRWTAVVHSGGTVALSVTGRDVVRPLAVGPNPQLATPDAATEAAINAGDALALDPGMKWMIDFDAAEAAGMALRIAVPPAVLAAGLDSLVVFGVAASTGATSGGSQFADLLDAHHYTDGLELIRLGAPSNNTDDRRAAYSSEDPAHARSFAIEMANAPVAAANALHVGNALGVPSTRAAATLGTIGGGTADADLDMRSMNTALWPVGWGYYLSNMIGPETGLTPDTVDWARTRFLNSVRGGGPFPVLRCGAQPYGVLPVTSLDLWAPDAGDAAAARGTWLRGLLVNMRDKVWRPVAGGVARVGRRAPSLADADLAEVMQTDAVSNAYHTRAVLGRHFVEHLYALNAQDFSSQVTTQTTIAGQMLQLLGLPTAPAQFPRLGHAFFDNAGWSVTAPLIQQGEVSPWRMLEPNYIGTLLSLPQINGIINARPQSVGSDGTSLLQTLLRHALLREIAVAAARIAATLPGNNLATLLRDVELVDLVNQPPVNNVFQQPAKTLHWQRQLELKVPAITGTATIRQFIEGLTDFSAPAVASLGQFRDSLAHLQTLDSEMLALLTESTLDLSAHRLDAWITSFATERLTSMTTGGSRGQFVGGYGWVENLRPAAAAPAVPATSLPPGEAGPLFTRTDDSGFIHAPSVTHASTAALLRNAHLGATGVPQANGPFAIDLSSRRVREASRLLDGVRQGQPLGALLGYRLERRLHDLRLDRFIARLRALAPLVVRARDGVSFSAAAPPPLESIGANNVVDGLVLLRRWQEETAVVQAAINGPAGIPPDPAAPSVVTELNALADSVDGLSDALTAESAYQLVRGNTSRLGATLLSIAQGDAPPPELEVARTPRTGNAITHRMLVLFGAASQPLAGWLDPNASVRASTERALDAWTSTLLGDPRRIRCTVEQLDDGGTVIATQSFPLSELSVAALDFVYGVDVASGGKAPSDMEQWVLYQAQRRSGGFGNTAVNTLRVQHARPTDLAAGEMTLFDALEQARAIRRLLEGSRGAFGDDLSPPERDAAGTVDLAELEARVVQAEGALSAAQAGLAALIANGTNTPSDAHRTALLALVALGVATAVPWVAVGDDADTRATLLRQSMAVAKAIGSRADQSAALRALPASADPHARYNQLLERARAVFGARFVLLPKIACTAPAAAELNSALAASTQAQGGDGLAAYTWFARYARVRDPLARLGGCLRNAEVWAGTSRMHLTVAQLPFDPADRWVGLPQGTDGKDLPMSKLSIVIQTPAAVDAMQVLTGLFVDEWVEAVPSSKETTALAFQFDPPDAVAPQNVLIAVPPVPGQDWTTESVRRVLMETLDLAKLRGVDTSLLGAASQYLPALYLPLNVEDDAVSTNFASLTR